MSSQSSTPQPARPQDLSDHHGRRARRGDRPGGRSPPRLVALDHRQERAALVRRVGELHVERREELAEIIVREMGKPIEQALGEVDFSGDIYGYYADNAEDAA